MSDRPPDFDDLVGGELEPSERARLLRVHDLLIEAGPPPDLPSTASVSPSAGKVRALRRPLRARVLALAATLGVVAFVLGFLVNGWASGPGTFEVLSMSGTAEARGATGSIELFENDDAGNWPMELRVDGLRPSASGDVYELWLTKGGRLAELCGSFLAEPDGSTVVPMNAPYRLREFDEWVVVEEGSKMPLLST
jgi:hypothetical protein